MTRSNYRIFDDCCKILLGYVPTWFSVDNLIKTTHGLGTFEPDLSLALLHATSNPTERIEINFN